MTNCEVLYIKRTRRYRLSRLRKILLPEQKKQSAEAVAAKVKADHLATLEAKAFYWIARGREANIELGRVFNQIKDILEHGGWEDYYEAKFAPHGVALRTAQEYMRMAREADADSKSANSALFPPATDPQANEINTAAEQAKQEVAVAGANQRSELEPIKTKKRRTSRPRLDGLYRLPLYLTGNQKDNLDALRNSENWSDAAQEIIATIDRLFVQYGLVNPGKEPELLGQKEGTLSDPYAAADDIPPALLTEETSTTDGPTE